jgi:uncharacterized YccA/Bax inhibitor family protein
MAMRASNPVLNESTFESEAQFATGPGAMTLGGTVMKTSALVIILVTTAALSWTQLAAQTTSEGMRPGWFNLALIGSSIGGLIVAMITSFAPKFSPFTAPLYAALEGVVLGLFSALFEAQFAGIVLQAIGLTVGVLIMLLFLYATRIIRVTENLKLGIVAATGAICLVYLAGFVLSFFGIHLSFINSPSVFGIGFSLFVVGIAAMNLVLDFDFIEEGAKRRSPKYMEWYAGFGLLVTLVWLYLEVLKLLSKLRSRD